MRKSRFTGDRGNLEHLGRFLQAEPAEEAHFDRAHFAGIESLQRVHGIVQGHQSRRLLSADQGRFVQGQVRHAASAFQIAAPRVVHQNAAHQLRRNGEKMGAVLPLHAVVVHQPQVGFVDQGRGLQAVAGALARHVAVRQAVKLLIDDRRQPFERIPVSLAPGAQQQAYVGRGRIAGLSLPPIVNGANYTAA